MGARIAGVALYLAWFTACSGQSGTEKDGRDEDCPEFAVEPTLAAMSGALARASAMLLSLPTGRSTNRRVSDARARAMMNSTASAPS